MARSRPRDWLRRTGALLFLAVISGCEARSYVHTPEAQPSTRLAVQAPAFEGMPGEYLSIAAQYVDPAKVDLDECDRWLNNSLPSWHLSAAQLKEFREWWDGWFKQHREWLQQYRQAGGGRMYWSRFPLGFDEHEPHDWWVYAVEPGADPARLQAWLTEDKDKGGLNYYRVGIRDHVVIEAGERHLSGQEMARDPEMSQAIRQTDAPVRAATIVQDWRAFQLQFPPPLGPWLNELMKPVDWVTLGIDPPPNPRIHLIVRCMNAAATEELEKLLADDLKKLAAQPGFSAPHVQDAIHAIHFTREGDELRLDLNEPELLRLGNLLGPLMKALDAMADAPKK